MDSISNPQNNNTSNSKNVILSVSALALLVVGIGTAAFLNSNNQNNLTTNTDSTTSSSTATVTTTSSSVITNSAAYKNGTYTASDTYFSPGGEENITVTIQLENNIVTSASVSQNTTDRESRQYQSLFANNFKQFVVGKNIDSIKLSRVSGSSLTSSGFNTALAKIKINAKA